MLLSLKDSIGILQLNGHTLKNFCGAVTGEGCCNEALYFSLRAAAPAAAAARVLAALTGQLASPGDTGDAFLRFCALRGTSVVRADSEV